MNNTMVCVDAGVVVSLVTPEDYSSQAESLWGQWSEQHIRRVAPILLRYEVTSVLRKKLWRGLVREDQAEQALTRVFRFPIQCFDPQDLHQRAWQLAARLNQPSAYDCHYLALAEMLDCDCWTTDQRLYNSVHEKFRQLHWLGNA